MTDIHSYFTGKSTTSMHDCQILGGGRLWQIFGGEKVSAPPPDPPLSQKFADPLTILKFADLRLPTPVFWSSHMYVYCLESTQHDLQNLLRNLEKNNRPSFQILVVNNLAHFAM